MPFGTFSRLQRGTHRVGEVLAVLGKYGLADWLRWLDVDWIQNRLRSADGQRLRELPLPTRIRLALGELGTTFIKLGQVLSTRPDLIGAELASELEQLQAHTTPDPPEVARATLQRELGRPPEQLFASFDDAAFASASIAQVHHATLADGTRVVVKLLRSDVPKRAAVDLEILRWLASLADRHAAFLRPYQPELLARQFQRTLQRELDFGSERRNLQRFARHFAGDPTVQFPRVYPGLCSRGALTMEFLDGAPAADPAAPGAADVEPRQLARQCAQLFLQMIFRDSFYHADPHPGNLLLLPGGVLGVIDCGMVGRIDDHLRTDLEAMLVAAAEHDAEELAAIVLRVGGTPATVDRRALRNDLAELLSDYASLPVDELDVGAALSSLFELVRTHRVVLPASLSLLLRTLLVLDGTSRRWQRDFSLAELIAPFRAKAVARRLSPTRALRRLRHSLRDWDRLLGMLPGDLRLLLERMRDGNLRVRLEHRHLDAVINRLTLGILVGALLLGSSAIWASNAPPHLFGVPLLGLCGFLLALWFGVRLLAAMRRSGGSDDRDDCR